MSRAIPYLAIFLALLACDKGAMKKEYAKAEEKAEEKVEEKAEEKVEEDNLQDDWGDELYTDGAAEEFDDEVYGYGDECDDSDCAFADEGEDPCADGACDPPPIVHKKFTGKAAKVEKQIVKERLQKDVAKVEELLKDLDTELAKK